MARKKNKKGKSGKSKKKGLFGWLSGGKEDEDAQQPEPAKQDVDMGIPDDFNPERTFVPDYAEDSKPSGGGFGDLPPGAERTMAPGYVAGDLPPGAEMTMAPGYVAGDLPPGAEMTMAPGYVGGDLPPGAEMTMAPGYVGGDLPPGAERTMAPGYAGPGGDPFSFDARDLGGGSGAAAGAPGGAAMPAGLRPDQSLDELNPFLAGGGGGGAPGATAPAAGAAGVADPFGPPLLDDPYSGEVMEGEALVGERTMVDIPADIEGLAELQPTDDVLAGEELNLGAPDEVAPAQAAASGTRRMFQRVSYGEDCVTYADPDPAVFYDVAKGYVYAPPVPEGWANVPPNLALLSDGCVLGHGDLDGHGTLTVATPPRADGEHLLLKLPASACYDPETRAVSIPLAAAGRTAWRPELSFASEEGVTFTLPAGSERGEDGLIRLPRDADGEAGPHGRPQATYVYLGVRETVYSDGWACLELPPDAEFSGGYLILGGDGPEPPPLVVSERLPDGRRRLELPIGSVEDGLSVWLPPACAPATEPAFDPQLGPQPKLQDVCYWAGVRDSLWEDGWIELVLPEGSQVCDGRAILPAPYAVTLTPELQFELTRDEDGRLSFGLPAHAEVLGTRILIPPAGFTPPTAKPLESFAGSEPATPPRPTGRPKAPEPPKPSGVPSVPSKATAKALDRFRTKKDDESQDDEAKDESKDEAKDESKDEAKDDESKVEAKDDESKDEAKDDESQDDESQDDGAKDESQDDESKDDESQVDESKDDESQDDGAKDESQVGGKSSKRKTKKRSRGKSK